MHIPPGWQHDAVTIDRPSADDLGVVGRTSPGDFDLVLIVRPGQAPHAKGLMAIAQDEALVLAQLRDAGGNAAPLEVARCRAKHAAALGNAMGYQVRLLHVGNAHIEIDVLADEVDSAINDIERDFECWIALGEERQGRRDVLASEPETRSHAQRPAGIEAPAGNRLEESTALATRKV